MAEGETRSIILPYHIKPVSVSNYGDPDTSSSKSETDIREQANFTEWFGSTSWCECAKCAPMPSGIECQFCKEIEGVVECVAENESHRCIMDHKQFNMFKQRRFIYSPCYTVEHNKRWSCKFTATQQVIIAIMPCSYILYRSYRFAAYRQYMWPGMRK